ncbi:MAG: type II secretion system protein [Deltaproteobacteria bacterium]|nr:type II secretion system protein [Deltaproteobacteria bacterium]
MKKESGFTFLEIILSLVVFSIIGLDDSTIRIATGDSPLASGDILISTTAPFFKKTGG